MTAISEEGHINGFPFYVMLMPLTEQALEKKEQPIRCPLCGNGWVNHVPTTARVFMSNMALFPNSACHMGCIDGAGGFQAAAEKLKAMYDECKAAREKFGPLGWIR